MSGYAKLAGSILRSTVWLEPAPTRLVWITMLALKDSHGVVESSIPGLAKEAGVELADCEAALECFLKPDRYSRTKAFEGRRIEEVDGGWVLLNHEKYKDLLSREDQKEQAASRKRRQREREAEERYLRERNRSSVTGTSRDTVTCHAQSRSVTLSHAQSRMSRHTDTDPNTDPKPPPQIQDLDTRDAASQTEATPEQPATTAASSHVNLESATSVPIEQRAQAAIQNPQTGTWACPQRWPEVIEVAQALHEAAGLSPPRLGAIPRDSGVMALLELYSAGYTKDQLLAVARSLPSTDWWRQARRGLRSLSPEVVRRAIDSEGKPRPEPVGTRQPSSGLDFSKYRKASES